jgi:hypothetical protein
MNKGGFRDMNKGGFLDMNKGGFRDMNKGAVKKSDVSKLQVNTCFFWRLRKANYDLSLPLLNPPCYLLQNAQTRG